MHHASYKALRYFPALDGVRAVAVLLTVAVHGGRHSAHLLEHLDGSSGVPIFFVLSGFLITTLLSRELEQAGRIHFGAFYVRRALRLLPVYFVVLAGYLALVLASQSAEAVARRASMLARLPLFLLYLNEYGPLVGPPSTVFGHTWSLGIEEKFYLTWPALAFGLWRDRRRQRLAGALGLALAFWAAFALPGDPVFGLSYGALLVGCALALVLHESRGFAALRFLAGTGAQLGVLVLVGSFLFAPGCFALRRTPWLALVIALGLAALMVRRSAAHRVLGSAPATYLGRRSYAIYLVHVLVIHGVDRVPLERLELGAAATEVLAYAAVVLISTLVAEGLFRLIEQPCNRLGARWSERLKAKVQSPIASGDVLARR